MVISVLSFLIMTATGEYSWNASVILRLRDIVCSRICLKLDYGHGSWIAKPIYVWMVTWTFFKIYLQYMKYKIEIIYFDTIYLLCFHFGNTCGSGACTGM
jgi:hypothetical protein